MISFLPGPFEIMVIVFKVPSEHDGYTTFIPQPRFFLPLSAQHIHIASGKQHQWRIRLLTQSCIKLWVKCDLLIFVPSLLCILGNKHMRSHLRRAKPPPFCKKFPVFNLPNLYIYIYPVKQWLTNSGIIILYLSGSAGAFRHVGITAARAWIRWNTELDTI